jgi:hypothetical protein
VGVQSTGSQVDSQGAIARALGSQATEWSERPEGKSRGGYGSLGTNVGLQGPGSQVDSQGAKARGASKVMSVEGAWGIRPTLDQLGGCGAWGNRPSLDQLGGRVGRWAHTKGWGSRPAWLHFRRQGNRGRGLGGLGCQAGLAVWSPHPQLPTLDRRCALPLGRLGGAPATHPGPAAHQERVTNRKNSG